ncbi:MAG: AMP-binding protein [Christensenellaceae bacterium]|jgi:acetyl-CoA synthetase|nr:AMP-binding protein [Christensenellaceae bacterium]
MSDIKTIAERVKYLREIFNLTYETVAQVVNVTTEQYIAAENGEMDFTFTFLQKIAKYYSVDLAEIISGEMPTLSGFQVVRNGGGMPFERRSGFKYLNLASLFKNKIMEPFTVFVKHDKDTQDNPIQLSAHNDDEFDYILDGKLKLKINNYETILEPGDSVYYDARLPHGMIAYEGDCRFLALVIKRKTDDDSIKTPELVESGMTTSIAERDAIYNKFVSCIYDDNNTLTKLDFHPPKNFNFAYDVVDAIADKKPNKPAMLWVSADKKERLFTFGEMKRLSDKCANFFLSSGIKKGDKVMLVLKRYYQFWPAVLALHKIGAIAIPATHLLLKKDFVYRINAAGVKAAVITTDGGTIEECESAISEAPSLKIKISSGPNKRLGWLDLDSGIENASEKLARIKNNIEDTMIMYFTSGTTGYPKITVHSHKYPLGHFSTAKFWHCVDPDGIHLTISDTGWAKSVWGKLYGQWLCEACIFTYNFERFNAADILEMFERYNITTFCAPPTMYRFFIKEDLSKYNLSSLKHATIAGEALNPEVYEQFYKATGLKLREGFGQTETTLTIFNRPGSEPKPGSMGIPFSPQYHIELVDTEGKPVETGVTGEIVIITDKETPYGMFCGYYEDPAENANAWYNNIYHTGDIAWRDEDGYIWYVGRIDDVIKSSGYRIGPFEVESVIMELPYVLECAVTGVPDETRGQIIKATIVLVKGTPASEDLKKEIQTYVKEHTAPYKYPRVIEFIDALPKTISGKIMRKDLR